MNQIIDVLNSLVMVAAVFGFIGYSFAAFIKLFESLEYCSCSLAVRCFPFMFFINSIFSKEGIRCRNKGGVYLLISLGILLFAFVFLVTLKGAWSDVLGGI